ARPRAGRDRPGRRGAQARAGLPPGRMPCARRRVRANRALPPDRYPGHRAATVPAAPGSLHLGGPVAARWRVRFLPLPSGQGRLMNLHPLLGIELPVIQAPMAGSQGSALAIAVSNAGGLGALPCAMLGPDALRSELEALR